MILLNRRALTASLSAVAVTASVAAVLTSQDSASGTPVHRSAPAQVRHTGHGTFAIYSGNTSASRAPVAHRHIRGRARAAQDPATVQAAQEQMFPVLARAAAVSPASVPQLKQIPAHQPDIDLNRARSLDASGRYWILPTGDGRICVGQVTSGLQTFSDTCGDDSVVASKGLSYTSDATLIGLVPAGASEVVTATGSHVQPTNGLVVTDSPSVTFNLNGVTRTL